MNDNMIQMLKESRDIPALMLLLSSSELDIKRSAAEALGDLEANEAVTALLRLLKDDESHVRLHAARSLGNIRDSDAVDGLIQSLSDKENHVKWNAAEALGKIGDPRAIEPLIAALKDKNKVVRKDALKALTGFTDARAQHALDQYGQSKQGHSDSTSSMSQMEKNKRAEDWMVAMTSGILAGIVFAVVRHNEFGPGGFIVVAFVYGWWILNFGLTSLQRVMATIVMLVIGIYGDTLLRFSFSL